MYIYSGLHQSCFSFKQAVKKWVQMPRFYALITNCCFKCFFSIGFFLLTPCFVCYTFQSQYQQCRLMCLQSYLHWVEFHMSQQPEYWKCWQMLSYLMTHAPNDQFGLVGDSIMLITDSSDWLTQEPSVLPSNQTLWVFQAKSQKL